MSQISFKFYFESKPDEVIQCKKSESILEPFTRYSRKKEEKIDDLIYYYKGSIFKYDEFNKNKLYINEVFDQEELKGTINIFAFPLRKTKKLAESAKTVLSASNASLGMSSSIEPMSKSKNEKLNKVGDSIETKNKIQSETKIQTKTEQKVEKKKFFNDIICPACQTSAIIENDNLRLRTINCENFHHISDIQYDKFEDFEEKLFDSTPENLEKLFDLNPENLKKLKCDLCSGIIYEMTPPENKLYICTCGAKCCGNCFKTHNDPNHYKCEIENKNYKCLLHGKDFKSYCLDCNKNICDSCDTHQDHEILKFVHLTPKADYIEKIKQEVENQKKNLSTFVEYSKQLLNDAINEIEKYINSYILVENTLLNRYQNNFRNFQLLQNLRNRSIFYENNIFKYLENYNNPKDLKDSLNVSHFRLISLTNLYKSITTAKKVEQPKEDKPAMPNLKNSASIIYKIPEKAINRNVKLFDSIFVKNNKDKCQLNVNGEEMDLREYFKNKEDKTEIKVQLTEKPKKTVTNMSYMFNNCQKLESVDFTNWNTINVTNMESLYQLSPITTVPNISTWNTQNVTNMRGMFSKCIKLKNIHPDISRWKLTNVKDLSLLFNGCKSLTSIPDLPKWDTRNVEDMSYMFSRCTNLKDLHGIGKWNTSKVKNMCGMFNRCENLVKLPDIKNWDMKNVTDISIMFQFCSKAAALPDISKWTLNSVKDISGVFSECGTVKNLPAIGRWNTSKVTCMCGLFNECSQLNPIPDISKWDTAKVTDMSGLFCGCTALKQLPNLTNWNTGNVEDMSYLLDGCAEIADITPIKNWDRKKVKDKNAAFNGCTKINKNDIDNWLK